MQFVVIARDFTDEAALQRRLDVRQDHVALGNRMREEGKALYGVALLDETGNMNGSIYVVDFVSRQELDEWLKVEPYVAGKVWDSIEIVPCKVGPSFTN